MSKKESSSSSPSSSLKIKLNADGTSNLDAAMLQEIHDYVSRLYPQTAVGTKTGIWRDIEKERPRLDEDLVRALRTPVAPSPKEDSRSGKSKGTSAQHHRFEEGDGVESSGDLMGLLRSGLPTSGSTRLDMLQYETAVEVYKKKTVKFETAIVRTNLTNSNQRHISG